MTGTTSVPERVAPACHVCGIVRPGVEAPVGDPLVPDGTDVRVVEDGRVAALVVMVPPDAALGDRSDLIAHSGVLNAVAASGEPVIPVRFGSVLASAEAVAEDLLQAHGDRWASMLAELDGMTQYTLRGSYDQDSILTEIVEERPDVAALRQQTSNRDEHDSHTDRVRLGELVAHAVDDKRAADAELVREALAPHCTAIRVTQGSGIDGLVDVAALVSDAQRSAFEEAAEELAAQLHERATLKLLGPLAPFDFVEDE